LLNILIGRSGCGKTHRIINTIQKNKDVRRSVLIVPEFSAHESERMLCELLGDSSSLYAEVLSFKRLSNRVFAECGGLADTILDNGGRILLMKSAVEEVKPALTIYSSATQTAEFIEMLLNIYDEFKRYSVDFSKLCIENSQNLKLKVQDLSLILSSYDSKVSKIGYDPADELNRVLSKLDDFSIIKNADIYIDGFSDFTVQQIKIIYKLIELAPNVTLSFTCDTIGNGNEIFNTSRSTIADILSHSNTEYEILNLAENHRFTKDDLLHFEQSLFRYPHVKFSGKSENIHIFEAENLFSECEYVADKILELVRDNGVRFNEIAVAANNFNEYIHPITAAFKRYGIPHFLDNSTNILDKSIIAFILSAIKTVSHNYRYDDIFECLKFNFLDVSLDECDMLENYCITWEIFDWSRDWTANPRGCFDFTENDLETLSKINEIRKRVFCIFNKFEDRIKASKSPKEYALSIYDFLCDNDIPKKLEEHARMLHDFEELSLAAEYQQLWDLICTSLDQCVAYCNEDKLSADDFLNIFSLMLGQYKISLIPISLDCVSAGSLHKMRTRNKKYLFILGATEGVLPNFSDSPSLFTSNEKDVLCDLGIKLSPYGNSQVYKELNTIYISLTSATDGLYFSYPLSSQNGQNFPSSLIYDIKTIFSIDVLREGQLNESYKTSAMLPCLDLALKVNKEPSPLASAAYKYFKEDEVYSEIVDNLINSKNGDKKLSQETVKKLYPDCIKLSASKIDTYHSCRFSYFMKYGLVATQRQRAGMDPANVGTFIHYVLEHTIKELMLLGGPDAVDLKSTIEIGKKHTKHYIDKTLSDLKNRTARLSYLIRSLSNSVERIIENVYDELSKSDFKPMAYELSFGENKEMPPIELKFGEKPEDKIKITGFIDRVDGWVHNDQLYLRVVDYKSGIKKFSLDDVWNGLGIQMLVYLFALEQGGKDKFGHNVIPAGVLYTPIRNPVVKTERNASKETVEKQTRDALKRSGIVLDDGKVVEAMYNDIQNTILPIKFNKNGSLSSTSVIANLEQFGLLKKHIDEILIKMGNEIKSGNFEVNPIIKQSRLTCEFCPYAAACQFDSELDNGCVRYRSSIKKDELWQKINDEGSKK